MVVVMPPFAEGQDGANQIVPTLVLGFVRRLPEQMADGIDAPRGMMHQEDPNESTPQDG